MMGKSNQQRFEELYYPTFRIIERRMQHGQMSQRVHPLGPLNGDFETEAEGWQQVNAMRNKDKDQGEYRDLTLLTIRDPHEDEMNCNQFWYIPGTHHKRTI